MKHILAIMKKELAGYFNSPVAYIVITVFLLLTGWLFFQQFFLTAQVSMRALFGLAPLLLIFFAPAITMRLISEERKAGTLELLVTLPLKNSDVIIGKFLAAVILLSVAILLTLPYAITVSFLGASDQISLDWGPVIGSYLGLILLGASYLSVGIFCSAISRNQIVSFIIGLALCFGIFLLDKTLAFLPAFMASIVQYLSVDYHFTNIARGVVDTRGLVYYASFISMFLLFAVHALDSERLK